MKSDKKREVKFALLWRWLSDVAVCLWSVCFWSESCGAGEKMRLTRSRRQGQGQPSSESSSEHDTAASKQGNQTNTAAPN